MMLLRVVIGLSLLGYIHSQSASASDSDSAMVADETTGMMDGMTDSGVVAASSSAAASAGASGTVAATTTTAGSTSTATTSTPLTCRSCMAKVSDASCGTGTVIPTDSTTTTCTGSCWSAKFHNGSEWYYIRGCLETAVIDKYGVSSASAACSTYTTTGCIKGTTITARTLCCTTSDCNTGVDAETDTNCSTATTVMLSSLAVYLLLVVIQKLF